MRFLSAIALLVCTSLASAQSTGLATVTGVVKDDSGAPIPGVTVVATRAQSEPSLAVTGMEGEFSIEGLVPGAYVIEANLDGFQPVKTNAKLVTGQKLDVAFKMLYERYPDITSVGEPVMLRSNFVSGIKRLKASYSA